MPIMSAAVSAGSNIIGDIIGAWSTADTNAQNKQLFEENKAWQTQMSNTAEQRRFADYKAAGVNPLLVTSSQGASTPSITPPTMEAPGKSFENLGQIATNAAQVKVLQSQADLNAANAEKARGDTKPHGPSVTVDNGDGTSSTGYASSSPSGAAQLRKEIADAENAEQQTVVLKKTADNIQSTTDLNNVVTNLDKLDLKTKQELYDTTLKKAKAEADAAHSGASIARAEANIYNGSYGPTLKVLEKLTGIVKHFIP